MKDENAPRNAQRWANEDEAFPSTDGHVRGIGLAMMAASGLDEKTMNQWKLVSTKTNPQVGRYPVKRLGTRLVLLNPYPVCRSSSERLVLVY